MAFENVMFFVEESIKQSAHLYTFLTRKHQLEQEYRANLAELCREYHKGHALLQLRLPLRKADRTDLAEAQAQLAKTSVWESIEAIVAQIGETAEAEMRMSAQFKKATLAPFHQSIKDLDAGRKRHHEDGTALTRNLQEAYTSLRRAKNEADQAQKEATEAVEAATKAAAVSKRKEVERTQARALPALERASQATEALARCERVRSAAQDDYFQRLLPALYAAIQQSHLQHQLAVTRLVSDVLTKDKAGAALAMDALETALRRARLMAPAADVEAFAAEHMVVDAIKDSALVSVRTLINPMKAGRMHIKRGDATGGTWVNSYFVLMPEERLLYWFDREDSEFPHEVIHLRQCVVAPLDDSYFGRSNCLQLVLDVDAPPASASSNVAAPFRQTYNLMAENAKEKADWLQCLRHFCYCCPKCAVVYQFRPHGLALPESPAPAVQMPLMRSLRLWIMEAKGLVLSSTIKGPCPYAIVLFNDVKQCRTSVKNGSDSPFWGEEFQFNAIAPCRSRIRLLFFSMSPMRIQKDVEIGYVSISLGALKTGKKVEEWYPIKMFAKKTDDAPPATNMGMVRVAYLLTNDQVLPETHEKAFLDLVMDPSLACIRALGQVLTQDREALAKALMTAAITRKCDTHLVTQLLRDDLRATDDPRILFRGNTLATKALDYYMKAVGAEYLRSTLGYHIKTIYALSNSCEVDPTRLPSGKDRLMSLELIDSVKRHWKRLLGHCSSLWDAIVHAADKMPPEMLHVFHHMARETDARYPDHPDAKYAAISGFLFLRFFVAAILNPKLFNMMPEHPTEHVARTLTLAAKILQNLANLVEFGEKEPHMAQANAWISEHSAGMRTYIDAVARPPPAPADPAELGRLDRHPSNAASSAFRPGVDPRRDTAALFQILAEHEPQLRSPAVLQQYPALGPLIPLVNELQSLLADEAAAAVAAYPPTPGRAAVPSPILGAADLMPATASTMLLPLSGPGAAPLRHGSESAVHGLFPHTPDDAATAARQNSEKDRSGALSPDSSTGPSFILEGSTVPSFMLDAANESDFKKTSKRRLTLLRGFSSSLRHSILLSEKLNQSSAGLPDDTSVDDLTRVLTSQSMAPSPLGHGHGHGHDPGASDGSGSLVSSMLAILPGGGHIADPASAATPRSAAQPYASQTGSITEKSLTRRPLTNHASLSAIQTAGCHPPPPRRGSELTAASPTSATSTGHVPATAAGGNGTRRALSSSFFMPADHDAPWFAETIPLSPAESQPLPGLAPASSDSGGVASAKSAEHVASDRGSLRSLRASLQSVRRQSDLGGRIVEQDDPADGADGVAAAAAALGLTGAAAAAKGSMRPRGFFSKLSSVWRSGSNLAAAATADGDDAARTASRSDGGFGRRATLSFSTRELETRPALDLVGGTDLAKPGSARTPGPSRVPPPPPQTTGGKGAFRLTFRHHAKRDPAGHSGLPDFAAPPVLRHADRRPSRERGVAALRDDDAPGLDPHNGPAVASSLPLGHGYL